MKKILFTLLLSIISFICNAQIYSKIEYYDKFDDVIKNEKIKTLVNINETDSIITVETKGRKEEVFWVLYKFENGTKNDVKNLVNNVYGYETDYYCINEKDTTDFYGLRDFFYKELDKHQNSNDNDDTLDYENSTKIVSKEEFYWRLFMYGFLFNEDNELLYKIKDRYISCYSFKYEYEDEVFWIKKNDGSRIIYSNN